MTLETKALRSHLISDMVRPSRRPFDDVPEVRRRIMRRIGNRDTGPERQLRSMIHRAGYRFRKNISGLPGRPDVVFKTRKKAIFVHGCFWHQHAACQTLTPPKTRTEYWQQKFGRTVARDARNIAILEVQGWQTLVIWECELNEDQEGVDAKLRNFLGPTTFVLQTLKS